MLVQLAVHTGIPFSVWVDEELPTIRTAQQLLTESRGGGTGKPQSDSRQMEG